MHLDERMPIKTFVTCNTAMCHLQQPIPFTLKCGNTAVMKSRIVEVCVLQKQGSKCLDFANSCVRLHESGGGRAAVWQLTLTVFENSVWVDWLVAAGKASSAAQYIEKPACAAKLETDFENPEAALRSAAVVGFEYARLVSLSVPHDTS
mmetsp:Transcript_75823/g.133942  ORF Transcript_75823/g.133942 Transcript_75823/m.133942 type:complete len:149 (+) Transcript_75823:80-526(+)|eukprot:CAMPEP_0197685478 /NCGR_PEP_ID=MMETSP1338-20131121/100990_1 /TAXON_ID=43686 ORGANISM="Pelagodinium beii, Strain RCC1491" /NCGR_SAMPLE_ID=MMETSP1338 /ASSEMBLY_ACC=CAM_ASM_000754 /LENGTH=148 /DNA_ID=CAMNT_0043267301 /DNA_START=76 /DNA_END=522 /DNA_ORIENTATION=+